MVLRIRLARFGKRHAPVYNIVLAHARTARNSKPLEVLGTYDPIPKLPLGASSQSPAAETEDALREKQSQPRKFKDIKLDLDRTRYWLGVGAQPSDTVWRLLAMVGLMEPKFRKQASATMSGQTPSNETKA